MQIFCFACLCLALLLFAVLWYIAVLTQCSSAGYFLCSYAIWLCVVCWSSFVSACYAGLVLSMLQARSAAGYIFWHPVACVLFCISFVGVCSRSLLFLGAYSLSWCWVVLAFWILYLFANYSMLCLPCLIWGLSSVSRESVPCYCIYLYS